MNVPENLKYSNDHEWLKVEGEFALIGITAYATDQLGDIVYVDVTSVDENLQKDEVFGTVEAVKTVSDLMMPVSGEVVEFNEELDADPALLNKDPYAGWIIKIKMTNPAELDDLLDAEAYKALI